MIPDPKQVAANIRESFFEEAPFGSKFDLFARDSWFRAAWLGKFLGLASSASELRHRMGDQHFVNELIELWHEYNRCPESKVKL